MDYIRGKIQPLENLGEIVEHLKTKGKKIVQCHGVFDLLHLGHIRHLSSARRYGDVLIVTITADKFVKRGPGRPVFNEQLRAEALANLVVVDFVSVVYSPTAEDGIRAIGPNFYAKGSDYANKEEDLTGKIYDEERAVNDIGGKIVFTDDLTFSSSKLLNNYLDSYPQKTVDYLKNIAAKYDAEFITQKLKALRDMRILVIGDAIIDQYYYCSPLGKSSKENIVVNRYLSKEYFAGGSLATANHCSQLSDNVELVTVLGEKNHFKDFILEKLDKEIKPVFFTRPSCVTTVKRRFVANDANKKLFEICFLDDHPLVESEETEILQYLQKNIKKYDLVIVSDFGHGMLTANIMSLLCKEAPCLALNVQTNSANVGFNLVTKYTRADFVCIDEPELRFATHDKYSELPILVEKIHRQIQPRQLIVTRGQDGSISYCGNGSFHETPAFASFSVDKVGAGDAFFSYTSPCFAAGLPEDLISFIGNAVGALAVQIVCNREPVRQVDLLKFITRLLKM